MKKLFSHIWAVGLGNEEILKKYKENMKKYEKAILPSMGRGTWK